MADSSKPYRLKLTAPQGCLQWKRPDVLRRYQFHGEINSWRKDVQHWVRDRRKLMLLYADGVSDAHQMPAHVDTKTQREEPRLCHTQDPKSSSLAWVSQLRRLLELQGVA